MEMDDKNRFERLTETLGEHCGMVELARVNEEDAMRWTVATAQEAGARMDPDAARELVDALGADMMLIASELEKLLLYTWAAGASRWATWRPWCWAPSSARSTS
jgi:DNA polymerase III subunit delta